MIKELNHKTKLEKYKKTFASKIIQKIIVENDTKKMMRWHKNVAKKYNGEKKQKTKKSYNIQETDI